MDLAAIGPKARIHSPASLGADFLLYALDNADRMLYTCFQRLREFGAASRQRLAPWTMKRYRVARSVEITDRATHLTP